MVPSPRAAEQLRAHGAALGAGGAEHDRGLVYTAPTEAAAMERFLEFCETWDERYPAIVRL